MKTAVSIPDEVYLRAERLAEQTNRSRSRLYSDALGEYLARHGTDAVTTSMNEALARHRRELRRLLNCGESVRPRQIRVVIGQGDVWWAELAEPLGSEPGFRRPVVFVQGDPLNRSRIATIVCVAVTSNLKWAIAPGNVLLPGRPCGTAQ